jgi:hypothetical protein
MERGQSRGGGDWWKLASLMEMDPLENSSRRGGKGPCGQWPEAFTPQLLKTELGLR